MASRTGRRRSWSWFAALAGCALAALAGGCPKFEVEDVQLTSVSADTAEFTLAATVVVTEDDPALEEDGDLVGGRGVLGIWLPPDWEPLEARAKSPDDADFAPLAPIPDGDGHFPAPFPWTPGAWFAFASPCDNVEEGTFEHSVEIDVRGPDGATAVTLGVSTAIFAGEGSNGAAPVEAAVDLSAQTVELREPPAAPEPAGLAECESIPYEEVPPEGESCGCAAPGGRPSAGPGLVSALLRSLL